MGGNDQADGHASDAPPAEIDGADFFRVDMRVGRIVSARLNERARVPAYALEVDLGEALGTRASSAQLTANYAVEDLVGRLVVAVVNLPPKRVAGVKSEVLVLGALDPERGTILLRPESDARPGARVG